jgi:hypothetical protein
LRIFRSAETPNAWATRVSISAVTCSSSPILSTSQASDGSLGLVGAVVGTVTESATGNWA